MRPIPPPLDLLRKPGGRKADDGTHRASTRAHQTSLLDLGAKLRRGGFDRPAARGAARFDGAGGRGPRATEVSSVHERVVIVARVVRTHGSI